MSHRAPKVLLVDDDEEICLLFRDLLVQNADKSQGITVRTAHTGNDALQLLESWKPDVALVDINLPDISGFDVCRAIRAQGTSRYVGIVIITSDGSNDVVRRSMEAGADEVCLKMNATTELAARFRTILRIKTMYDDLERAAQHLKAANKRLRRLSITDELTGLYNMRLFRERMVSEFDRARRYHKSLSLIMLDIDHFKAVNDNCDHIMGSFVIAQVGRRVARSIRDIDIGARYGGDEFCVLLPETDESGALSVATRLADSVRGAKFEHGGDSVSITLSVGIGTLTANDRRLQTATDLLRVADHNLYEAKRQGRDCIISARSQIRGHLRRMG